MKLKRLRDAVGGGDVKPYPADKWTAAKDKDPDLKKAADGLDKLTDGLSKVDEAAKRLATTVGKDASAQGAEAKRFLDLIADDKVSPNRAIDPGDKLLKKVVPYAPAGVVGEESDPKFKLSAAEFVKDPKKAADRLKARYDAMKVNADQLKAAQDHLKTIRERAKGSKELVDRAAKNAEDFVQRGGIKAVNTESVRKHFDGKKLSKLYADLADEAETQEKAAKKAAEAQKKQLDTFKRAVRDQFDIDL
ncbi:MAG: hypothetical protein K2X82_07425 [Gemmataceae bacterium]|nr:hypothetical protein [Gemmataceae bacterium]